MSTRELQPTYRRGQWQLSADQENAKNREIERLANTSFPDGGVGGEGAHSAPIEEEPMQFLAVITGVERSANYSPPAYSYRRLKLDDEADNSNASEFADISGSLLEWTFDTRAATTTNGSPTITGLGDTSLLVVGMTVSGYNFIPNGAYIKSKGAGTVTLGDVNGNDLNATGNGSELVTFALAGGTTWPAYEYSNNPDVPVDGTVVVRMWKSNDGPFYVFDYKRKAFPARIDGTLLVNGRSIYTWTEMLKDKGGTFSTLTAGLGAATPYPRRARTGSYTLVTRTGTTTNGSPIIGAADTTGIVPGMIVYASTIPNGAQVVSVETNVGVEIDVNATGNATGSIAFLTLTNPAYEINNTAAVPTGKIVWMEPGRLLSPTGDSGQPNCEYFFFYPVTTVQDDGTPLTQRSKLNFMGRAIRASDDSGNARTNVSIAMNIVDVVANSRWAVDNGGFLPPHTLSEDGTTLTASANGALPAIDGITPWVGMDILLCSDEAGLTGVFEYEYGIWRVTSLGSAGSPWTMVRPPGTGNEYDFPDGSAVFVIDGRKSLPQYEAVISTYPTAAFLKGPNARSVWIAKWEAGNLGGRALSFYRFARDVWTGSEHGHSGLVSSVPQTLGWGTKAMQATLWPAIVDGIDVEDFFPPSSLLPSPYGDVVSTGDLYNMWSFSRFGVGWELHTGGISGGVSTGAYPSASYPSAHDQIVMSVRLRTGGEYVIAAQGGFAVGLPISGGDPARNNSEGSLTYGITGTVLYGATVKGGIITELGSAVPTVTVSGGSTGMVFGSGPAYVMSGILSTANGGLGSSFSGAAAGTVPTANGSGGFVAKRPSSFDGENKGAVDIMPGMIVATHSSGSGVVLADASVSTLQAIGISVASAEPTFSATIQTSGLLTLADWTDATGAAALSADALYYADPSSPGMLTTTCPTTAGQIVQIIGASVSPDTLELLFEPPILL